MKRTIIIALMSLAVFVFTGTASAQKLVYNPKGGKAAPRSKTKYKIKNESKDVLKARKNTKIKPHVRFNRLHKPIGKPQLAPTVDKLHDDSLEAVKKELLPPKEGMAGLELDSFGNRIDWVKAFDKKQYAPISQITDDAPKQEILTNEIVIQSVGWTQDVIFPHKAHSEMMACNSCHLAQTFNKPFFVKKAGGNPMTMVEIQAGKWCGWCHSGNTEKVAFPLSDCQRCHSGPVKTKPVPLKKYMLTAAKTKRSNVRPGTAARPRPAAKARPRATTKPRTAPAPRQ